MPISPASLPFDETSVECLYMPELEHIAAVELRLDLLIHPVDEQLVVKVRLLDHPRRKVDWHRVTHSRPVGF